MPPLTLWTLRLSLVYLALGFSAGALMLINKALMLSPWLFYATAMHRHLLIYGWTLHVIVGVAHWILPTFGDRTNHGREVFAIASIVQLSAATLAGCLSAWPAAWPWLDTLAAALAASGVMCFAIHLWPRIKSFGR
ncbi:MAG: hypothetical protein H0U74_00310 [Bradymonadaceae bacterium]|nr:hypothetical protein [Lujinxingiaceae bacterium]